MGFYGKMEDHMKAIILSANDVIADILYIKIDEDGIRPLGMGQIDLPPEARIDRERDPLKEPRYKRGDVIKIRVHVFKTRDTELKAIDELVQILAEVDEDNAEIYYKLEERNKKFDRAWRDMCLKERQTIA